MYTPSAAEKQKTKILENMKNSTNVKKTTNSLEYIDSLYIEPERWKYFAGMIDGDGYLGSYISYRYRKKIKPKQVTVVVVISKSTNLKSLQEQQNELKGYTTKIYPDPDKGGYRNGKVNGDGRNIWSLWLTGTDEEIIDFLENVRPHLDNKQRQCELLIQILRGIDVPQSLKELEVINFRGKDQTFTYEEKLLLEKFSDEKKSKFPIKRTHFIDDNIISSAGKGAGCMDSDGSIWMKNNSLYIVLNTSAKESYTYKLEQKLINSDEFYYTTCVNKNKDTSKPSTNIYIKSKYHLKLLKFILPWMITRREQAIVAIDYLEGRITAAECYKMLRDLTKRGKENWKKEDEQILNEQINIEDEQINIDNERININLPTKKVKKSIKLNVNTKAEKGSTVNVNISIPDSEIMNPLGVDDGRRVRRRRKRY